MTRDVSSQILELFSGRLEHDHEVSERTRRALLDGQRQNDFGDDDELLAAIVRSADDT